jgi:putative ABC transport system permease protein
MPTWSKDLRLALRMLRRRPGFTTVVSLTLALGIGCTTALFGVFRTVFLEPLPLPDSGRLTFVMEQGGFGCCGPASGPDYTDWVRRQRAFAGMGILNPGSVTLTGDGEAARVYATAASASVFRLLGVAPALGRTFTREDEVNPSVVVLSDGLWQRRFGGRRDVLGKTFAIDGASYTVIGVMPRGFDVPSPWLGTAHHQLYTPFNDAWLEGDRGSHGYPVVARLAPGVTLQAAQSDMDRVMRELAEEYPATNSARTARMFTAHAYMYGDSGRELGYILGAAALVLLIACGNVAGLQLARAAARETELAVRAALGASRGALVRLLFSESVMLAAIGGLGGMLVAVAAVRGLRAVLPPTMPRIADAHVDGWALVFAMAAAAFTALVFGIVPSILASRGGVAGELREGGYGTRAPGKQRARDAFIVAQIALGLVLANGAALLVRSYARLRSLDPGFRGAGVLTVGIEPSGERFKDGATLSNYYNAVLERVRAVPGVTAAGTVSRLPLYGGTNGTVWIEGRPPRTGSDQGPLVEVTSITGDYFQAIGLQLLRGRLLRPEDSISGAVGVVINQHFANEAWPGANPLGKRFSFSDSPPHWTTVVGVVNDVRQWGPERPPVSQVYYPLTQGWTSSGYLVVRTAADPASLGPLVRRAILAVDPTQAPSEVQTMASRVGRTYAQRRFYTTLIGLFAVAALLLAGAGVYGTVSYYVTRRTRELGIRIALGADRGGIVGLVVRRGVRLAAWGMGLGLVGVWAASTVVGKLLYGVGPLDPATMLAGCATLALVAAAASAVPAGRAVRVPPALALRAE